MSGFKKAVLTQRPLRMAVFGPSNCGKTFTSLMIARELVGPNGTIALIDTERFSASRYAKHFDFDTSSLTKYAHTDYIAEINQAKGYDFLIIDSVSHAWEGEGGILDLVESVVARQKKEDSFRAWANPVVKKAIASFWAAILDFPGHVIVTMRAKTVYERSVDKHGKTKIEKLGLGPIQRGGVEFEFDIIAEMDRDHNFEIVKARDPDHELDNLRVHEPGVKFARKLKDWLEAGTSPSEDYGKRIASMCEEIAKLMGEDVVDVKKKAWKWIELQYETNDLSTISNEDLAQIPEKLMNTYGPGDLEEQRQSRMADREDEAQEKEQDEEAGLPPQKDLAGSVPGIMDLYEHLKEVVEQHTLDKTYVWGEICKRAIGAEPTLEELEYLVGLIIKNPDLWREPEEENDNG